MTDKMTGHSARLKATLEKQQQAIEEQGWIAHHVIGEGSHTHGLKENFQHPDLEIKLYIPQEVAHGVLSAAVGRIKKGERFKSGQIHKGIIANFGVMFVETYKDGCPHIRIVLPDPDGELEKAAMSPEYRVQYD